MPTTKKSVNNAGDKESGDNGWLWVDLSAATFCPFSSRFSEQCAQLFASHHISHLDSDHISYLSFDHISHINSEDISQPNLKNLSLLNSEKIIFLISIYLSVHANTHTCSNVCPQ